MMFQRSYIRSIPTIAEAAATTTTTTSDKTELSYSPYNKDLSNVQQLARTTKSQQQHIQLKSSFCRLIIAISTLRQTTSTEAAAASGHYPLISLLKLFLICFYYLVAVASFLLILIYINHIGLEPKSGAETLMLKPETAIITSMFDLDDGGRNNSISHTRVSRSIPEVATPDLLTAEQNVPHSVPKQVSAGPTSSFSSPAVMIESLLTSESRTFESHGSQYNQLQSSPPRPHQQTNRKKEADTLLAEQLARGQSLNNRGTMASSVATSTSSKLKAFNQDNQERWIPIVGTRSPVADSSSPAYLKHYGLPTTVVSHSLERPSSRRNPTELSLHEPMLSAQSHHSFGDEFGQPIQSRHRAQKHHQLYNNHYHRNYPNLNMDPHPSYNRHWRRPRFNFHYEGPPRHINKIYKVVLLCDKTLVSLDYIKRFKIEPPPRPYAGPTDDFDENDIDLDSHLDPIFAAAAAGRRQAERINNFSSIAIDAEPIDVLASESGDNFDTENLRSDTISPRSYLSEVDPLVKCDMWDLEKGLKKRKPPIEILAMAVRADFDTVRDAINRCRQLSEKMLPPDDEYRDGMEIMSTEDLVSLFSMKRGLIPGTKWCGLGDMASSYNDLGPKHRIDICCRAHDHCPIRLKPFRNDYGILNIALYTKSHCDCDADFYRCLREVHSRTADMLGNLYFNVMKLQCMREERMKVCREMKPIALGFERCVKYSESPMRTVFKFTTPPVAY